MKRYLILASFICLSVFGAEAKPKKLKLSETAFYLGEVDKKLPKGEGIIYVMDRPSKEPTERQDVITGTFDGDRVTGAKVEFSSGWTFVGELTYSASTVSKKPLTTEFVYVLTGRLMGAEDREAFWLDHVQIKRTTVGEGGSLESGTLRFEAKKTTASRERADYLVNLETDGDKWTATESQRMTYGVYYSGKEVSITPHGPGVLTLLASDDMMEREVLDEIHGNFDGTSVTGAWASFSSGWTFIGDLKYSVKPVRKTPYKVEVVYTLTGELKDASGALFTRCKDLEIRRTLTKGRAHLENAIFNDDVPAPAAIAAKYQAYTGSASATMPKTFSISEQADGGWKTDSRSATTATELHYDDGTVVTESGDGFSIRNAAGDYLEVKGGRISELSKTFSDGTARLDGISSRIAHSSGDTYKGTFSIDGMALGARVSGYEEVLGRILAYRGPSGEIPLMYLAGTLTGTGGTTVEWKNGFAPCPEGSLNPAVLGGWKTREFADTKAETRHWIEVQYLEDGSASMTVEFAMTSQEYRYLEDSGIFVSFLLEMDGSYRCSGKALWSSFDTSSPVVSASVRFSPDCPLTDEKKGDVRKLAEASAGQLGSLLIPIAGQYTAGGELKQIVLLGGGKMILALEDGRQEIFYR